MINFFKKYKAFAIGLVVIPLFYILDLLGYIILPEGLTTEVAFIFVIWWLMLSMVIHNIKYFIKKKILVFKLIGLLVLFVVVLMYDSNRQMPDNPLTLSLMLVFWLGIAYTLQPVFFKKYQYYILGAYTLITTYFTYVRLSAPSFDYYAEQDKDLALALFLIPIPLILLLWVYEQWKWLKSLQSDKTKAELELLKTQVNPHFFFNTLNNLYSLTVKHSDEAPGVILKLSEMMRYSIYEGKKDLVPLKEEIVYLQNYLDLHKIRYHKTVDIVFVNAIDENDSIAPLLFIILLENALKHGVESLSDSAYIKMHLSSVDGQVKFSLENNFDLPEVNQEPGIGLDNLKRRLALIYPKKHTFDIQKSENVFRVSLNIDTQ